MHFLVSSVMGLLEENLDVTVCVKHMQMSKLKFFSHLVQFFFI